MSVQHRLDSRFTDPAGRPGGLSVALPPHSLYHFITGSGPFTPEVLYAIICLSLLNFSSGLICFSILEFASWILESSFTLCHTFFSLFCRNHLPVHRSRCLFLLHPFVFFDSSYYRHGSSYLGWSGDHRGSLISDAFFDRLGSLSLARDLPESSPISLFDCMVEDDQAVNTPGNTLDSPDLDDAEMVQQHDVTV
ncbi:hypothetical protein KSP40_PGU000689 [Platanthera guangdongensis]|uniref:Uncharacterized protein n=1 Tax=Platanthera guangdongensis TaxID=2320717 RepID=A0ABR2MBR9_9ASPA